MPARPVHSTSTALAARAHAAQPYVIAAFRVIVALLFLCHGLAKLFGIFGGTNGSGGTVPVGAWPLWYAGLLEVVLGVLVMIGLGTRLAALLLSGEMAYAYFSAHQSGGLWPLQNGGETAVLFCWIFLLLAFIGPGAFSVDHLIAERRRADADADAEADTGRDRRSSTT
ncbi:DoxX family protein [Streptomyces sp. J2-1]|uniref:DoxX family protein n=1 Tax=Streptomyces corallincola TaxID=2851888 RepID=UPI001C38E9AF|nr:DoxX family protein [Streptomyces corallincola]MBV2355395.1 DoxX family protein [Streptomyces corallincola]